MVERLGHGGGHGADYPSPRRRPFELLPGATPRHVLHVRIAANLYAIEPPFGRRVGRPLVFRRTRTRVVPLATVNFSGGTEVGVEIRGALTLTVGDDSLQQDTACSMPCPSPKSLEPRGWTRQ